MNDSILDTLTQRLDRLERKVRWWKALVVWITVAGLGLLFMAARPASVVDEIRARRFVLVAQDGRERARLIAGLPAEDLNFPAVLQFLDKQGRMVSHIGVLTGRDGKERGRAEVESEEENRSVLMIPGLLSLRDDKGHARLSSQLVLTDDKGHAMLSGESLNMSRSDIKGGPTFTSVSSSGVAIMKDGKVIWTTP